MHSLNLDAILELRVEHVASYDWVGELTPSSEEVHDSLPSGLLKSRLRAEDGPWAAHFGGLVVKLLEGPLLTMLQQGTGK